MTFTIEQLKIKFKGLIDLVINSNFNDRYEWFFIQLSETVEIILPEKDEALDLFVLHLSTSLYSPFLIRKLCNHTECENLFFLYLRVNALYMYFENSESLTTICIDATNNYDLFYKLLTKTWLNGIDSYNLSAKIDITEAF